MATACSAAWSGGPSRSSISVWTRARSVAVVMVSDSSGWANNFSILIASRIFRSRRFVTPTLVLERSHRCLPAWQDRYMPQDDGRWPAAFPVLFANSYVDYADCQLGFTLCPVPDELVARLHLVAMTPQRRVIVCRSVQGWRFLPGGTREE